jgi:hypothetical protein
MLAVTNDFFRTIPGHFATGSYVTIFSMKRVVLGMGMFNFNFWEEGTKHLLGTYAVPAGAESPQQGGPN